MQTHLVTIDEIMSVTCTFHPWVFNCHQAVWHPKFQFWWILFRYMVDKSLTSGRPNILQSWIHLLGQPFQKINYTFSYHLFMPEEQYSHTAYHGPIPVQSNPWTSVTMYLQEGERETLSNVLHIILSSVRTHSVRWRHQSLFNIVENT